MARPRHLVATLGPASLHLAAELAGAGATGLRLNASHMLPRKLGDAARAVRATCPEVPIVVDLQGAKMRLGTFAARPVARGERLCFAGTPNGVGEIPLPHPELFRAVGTGDTLSCSDGRIRLRVIACDATRLEAECLDDGMLRPRKGINVLEHPVDLEGLSEFDVAHVRATCELPRMHYAFSFMKDGREAAWVREYAGEAPVVGKIERLEATHGVPSIAAHVDEAWVCRGDLGAQVGLPAMARFIGAFDPRTVDRPVLMAGQVLEHLTRHPAPTRSEVCHVFDLLARGYAGIVLSDETAVGADPVRAVTVAAELLATL